MPNDSALKAPEGKFRLTMDKLPGKHLDFDSLKQAKIAFKMLTEIPDSEDYAIIIHNDTGGIELSNST